MTEKDDAIYPRNVYSNEDDGSQKDATRAQFEMHMVSTQYETLLKKHNDNDFQMNASLEETDIDPGNIGETSNISHKMSPPPLYLGNRYTQKFQTQITTKVQGLATDSEIKLQIEHFYENVLILDLNPQLDLFTEG